MAVIRKIRNYSGLLIVVIGVGLAAFVLGDFLGQGPVGQQQVDVGKVEGTSITYQQFEQRVNRQMENWAQQTGENRPGPEQTFQIRQQVWNEIVKEILLEEQFEDLGINVSSEELYNMIHGNDPHPTIVQSFTDPATGQYDPQQVIEFLQNFDRLEPSVRQQWLQLEDFIKKDRREQKYHELISQGYLVPDPLAVMDYRNRNTQADIRFAFKAHRDIPDDDVQVSESELETVYENHKHRFETDALRDIKYAMLTVFPSEEDRENTLEEIEALKQDLQDVENVPPFVNSVSDERFDPTYHEQGALSPQIDPDIFDASVGDIFGPYEEDNAFKIAMLLDTQMRPDSMRASHILIAYQGSGAATEQTMRTPEEAEAKADSILGVVRNNPAAFPQLAVEESDDQSAQMTQGDLDWFQDGEMVPAFNEAAIETPVGQFTTVESDFGYHVIHVTDKSPLSEKVQVAEIVRYIEPGNRTYQDAYARISTFASELREGADFDTAAEEADLNVREAERVGTMDMRLPGIEQGRQIVQWAFDEDTDTGDFSRIFELEDTFVVATLMNKQDEGIPSLDEVRDNIMAIAMEEKKQEMIADEMAQLMNGASVDDIAAQMDIEVQEATHITFTNRNIPGVGPEPKVIGALFANDDLTIKGPMKGNNGVFIVEVTRMEEADVPEDLTNAKTPLQNAFRNRVPNQAFDAVKEKADIEDNRAMFF